MSHYPSPFKTPRRSPLVRLVLWPVQFARWSFQFAFIWLRSRKWTTIWAGLPSVVVLLTTVAVLDYARRSSRADLTQRYQAAAERAFEDEEFEMARDMYQKLLELGGDEKAATYGLALALYELDEQGRALGMLSRLAPTDRFGYAPAHMWFVDRRLEQDEPLQEQDAIMVRQHLRHVVRNSTQDDERALVLLAQLEAFLGEPDNAIDALEQVVERYPNLRQALAALYRSQGRVDAANRQLDDMAVFYEKRIDANPTDLGSRIMAARARTMLEEYPKAEKLLQSGFKLANDEQKQAMQIALAQFYLAWHDQTEKENITRRLDLIERALILVPNLPAALNRLSQLMQLDDEVEQRGLKLLEQKLAEGHATAGVHMVIGTQALLKGNLEKAKLHFQQAIALNPKMPAVLNNLAWTLANSEDAGPEDLEEALLLADQAVELLPNVANIRETRGQIYTKLERWEEAITDLEIALRTMRNNPDIHHSLEKCYRALGDDELADEHKRKADEAEAMLAEMQKARNQQTQSPRTGPFGPTPALDASPGNLTAPNGDTPPQPDESEGSDTPPTNDNSSLAPEKTEGN